MLIVMAPSVEMTRLLLAVHFLLLAVSIVNAGRYFNGEDETRSGLLGVSQYGENRKAEGSEEEDGQQERQLKSGLYAARETLRSHYPGTKRSWMPDAQTGMYAKRHDWRNNPVEEARMQNAMAKRQLWANQQSGLFGKRMDELERTLERSEEERDFERETRGGGVPHVFQSGGIFGKRSSDDWAKRYE